MPAAFSAASTLLRTGPFYCNAEQNNRHSHFSDLYRPIWSWPRYD